MDLLSVTEADMTPQAPEVGRPFTLVVFKVWKGHKVRS